LFLPPARGFLFCARFMQYPRSVLYASCSSPPCMSTRTPLLLSPCT
jgi:hypothetical protein